MTFKSVKVERVRVYIRSIVERGKFEVSAVEMLVTCPKRRDDFGSNSELFSGYK